ncbi:MAG: methyltransferase domain-containing protein [Patescibacteria group bacterium]|nr:methyltransferase domain-containing protein [Patescibacteria group bacterium]
MPEDPKWIEPELERSVKVSPREYEIVEKKLHIPRSYFVSHARVLSVGEGLSDYSKKLGRKYKVDAIALDPIYELGKRILNKDPKKVAKILQKEYGEAVEYIGLQQNFDKVPLPEKKRMIAGSTYNLPFSDAAFDLVVTNRMVEHIDLSKALPELVRVLKPSGELRMAGMFMVAQLGTGTLYPYQIEFSGSLLDWGYHTIQTLGTDKAFEWLQSQSALKAYVVADKLPRRSEVRDGFKAYEVGVLMIRKDDQIPQVESLPQEDMPAGLDKKYPYLGKLFRIGLGPEKPVSTLPVLSLKTDTK